MKNNSLYSLLIAFILVASCKKQTNNSEDNISNSGDSIENKVAQLLSKMTLEEKIGQMNQYNGFWDVTGPKPANGDAAKKYEHLKKGYVGSMLNVRGVKEVRAVQKIAVEETRLGIPLIIGFDVIHGYKTLSPIPLAEAASWDLEAIKKSAQVAAKESAAAGINWTFAPMVDISRDARWGRVMEGAGEDPYLGSKIAIARVQGFQGDDLSSHETIAACAKHWAGYGFAEAGRDYNTVDIGTSTLYNIIFPPFKAATEAGVKTFMNSFNELNGIPATGNVYLQRDILKDKWGFDGFVVSDWGSINEMIAHGYAKDKKHASELSVIAGSDMDMESYAYVDELANLVREGKVKESLIDDAVTRILKVKFELGLFDDPYKYCNEAYEKEVTGSQDIHDAVLDVAKKSIVLLKNENQILPLKKEGQHIALIGALAADKTSPLGSWRIAAEDNTAVSVLEGLQKYTGNKLTYAKGADLVIGKTEFAIELNINTQDKSGFPEAIETAKRADVVVMVLGEHGFQSGEARSRTDLNLPGVQQELLEAVYKVNKNIVLVLNNGRPLTITWADKHIPAIVEAWHLGTQSGNAVAQVLYGDYNPSGKLPMSFPRNVGQVPIYYNYKNTGRPVIPAPNEVFWSHYIDESNDPLYPFGHGLSYTTFSYNNMIVKKVANETIEVSVDVKNTGNITGKEVAQLYIQDLFASVTRPVKELKGFKMVELKPNHQKTIKFSLTEKELGFYNNDGEFILEPGEFKVYVGGSSKTVLESKFNIE
ncbi:Periplasmic beta-glucosidase precursor [Mariniflexile rhizosphaerae]|uniref:beta-glucosidase BglX n=1 Tax=unclassified Mariniflexile TaxID=2643887 RepID=UPI000CBA718F|nr:beta-glucosidase BglX [Mariniflexile sp. TRM1-10]AXP80732.1 Periplasmic beta-glucosidase precursor [Mariniflexile sp. TRM1-10]PLB19801.1 MAG: Beta-glucosidase [Flavobacteriaceae bacterium FS1-H7996/R]